MIAPERGRPQGTRRTDWALVVALFTLSAATSVLLDAGVVCPNDGSHYALVRALGDRHTVVIDEFVEYTRHIDISQRGAHFYSDRAPGTAFAALPFYLVARAAGLSDVGRQEVCALLSVLVGALAVALTYGLGRRIGLGTRGATAAALTLALCTPHRSYSTALWSHAFSAFLVVLGAFLATPAKRSDGESREAPSSIAGRLLLGLVAGYSISVDYSAAVVSALLLGVVAISTLRRARPVSLGLLCKTLLPLGLGAGLGVLPALIYNDIAFGSPLRTGYSFHVLWPETRSLSTMYGGGFFEGLRGLLIDWRAGLLLYSPILGLGFLYSLRFGRELGPRRALTTLAPWVLMLLLTSKHATWHGGGAHDARYLMLVMPLFCLPVGAAYVRATTPGRLHLFTTLFLLSLLVQFFKHTAGWLRNPLPHLTAIVCTIKFDIDGVHGFDAGGVGRLLSWLYPHPRAAAALLIVGLSSAALIYLRVRGKGDTP
jgi:hypothetical protein